MIKPLKIMKVSQIPAQPDPDAIYFSRSGSSGNFRMFVTSSSSPGNPPTVSGIDYGTSKFYGNVGSPVVVRDNVNLVRNVVTSATLVTFVLTENGLTAGTPIFSNLELCRIIPTVIKPVTSANQVQWCAIHDVNLTTNTVVIRVMRDRSFNGNTTLLVLNVSGPGFVV